MVGKFNHLQVSREGCETWSLTAEKPAVKYVIMYHQEYRWWQVNIIKNHQATLQEQLFKLRLWCVSKLPGSGLHIWGVPEIGVPLHPPFGTISHCKPSILDHFPIYGTTISSHIIPYHPILSHIIPYHPILYIPYHPILSHNHIIPCYPISSHIIPVLFHKPQEIPRDPKNNPKVTRPFGPRHGHEMKHGREHPVARLGRPQDE